MAQRDKVADFIALLLQAQKAKQTQGTTQQNPGINVPLSGAAPSVSQNPGGPMAVPSRQPFSSTNANSVSDGIIPTTSINLNPAANTASGSRLSQNPISQQQKFLWRGGLSITGQDGRRATPELLVYLSAMKASPQQSVQFF